MNKPISAVMADIVKQHSENKIDKVVILDASDLIRKYESGYYSNINILIGIDPLLEIATCEDATCLFWELVETNVDDKTTTDELINLDNGFELFRSDVEEHYINEALGVDLSERYNCRAFLNKADMWISFIGY